MLCNSCECVYVNGIKCHEIGCPEAWRDYKRKCEYCGMEFTPEHEHEKLCSQECYNNYYGV